MNHLRFLLNPRETYYRSQHTPVARLLRRAETIIDASCRLYLIVVFIVSMAALNTALTLKFGNQPEDHSEYHAKLLFYWKDALAEPPCGPLRPYLPNGGLLKLLFVAKLNAIVYLDFAPWVLLIIHSHILTHSFTLLRSCLSIDDSGLEHLSSVRPSC